MMKFIKAVFVLIFLFVIGMFMGCSPEIGSDGWCEDMQEKPKEDWTAAEVSDYAKNCLFK